MKRNGFCGLGMLVVLLVFGFILMGCDTGNGTGNGIVIPEAKTPSIINGYYGVTSDGKTLELLITVPSASKAISKLARAVIWEENCPYTLKVDGVVISTGTIKNTDGNMTFVPSDSSTVTPTFDNTGVITRISVTKADGTTYSGDTYESKDFFYCIGAPTSYTASFIKTKFEGMTPEQVHEYCWSHSQYFSYPDSDSGNWEEIKVFGRSYKCPETLINSVGARLEGKVSAWDSYTHSEYGLIMFYVSRIPFD
jgi:hypothetical protein